MGAIAAVVVLSQIALTLDEIDSVGLRVAYGATVTTIAGGVVWFVRSRWRRGRPAAPRSSGPPRASAQSRMERLFARHRLDDAGRAQADALRRKLARGEAPVIAITGLPRTGKSKLAAALAHALPERSRSAAAIRELPALSIDFAANLERLATAAEADLVLFVVDQDMRDYEFAALQALVERGLAPLLVINKADRLGTAAVAETRAAIARRVHGMIAEADIVAAAADPMPVVRMVNLGSGRDSEEELPQPPQMAALADRVLARLDPRRR